MKIGAPQLRETGGDIRYQTSVAVAGSDLELWFSVPDKHADLISSSSDAALVGLLIPAMAAREEIRISGVVSERLHRNLSGPLQEILIAVLPGLHGIEIHAEEVIREKPNPNGNQNRNPESIRNRNGNLESKGNPESNGNQSGIGMGIRNIKGIATGFSAGIDAFCTLRDHHYGDPPDGLRLTHLTFFNVGSHFRGGESLFRERFTEISQRVDRFGLPFIPVNSNLDSFYHQHSYQQTLTLRNISAACVLQAGIGTYLHSSGQFEGDQRIAESESIASADIFVLPLLSSGALEAVPAGGKYTRVEKTLLVAEIEDSYELLHVCNEVMGFRHCCRCQKCLRAMLTLEIGGYLSRYSSRFDLDLYASLRSRFIAQLHFVESIYNPEVIELIAERNFKSPLISRLYIHFRILQLQRLGRRIVRKIKRIARISQQ